MNFKTIVSFVMFSNAFEANCCLNTDVKTVVNSVVSVVCCVAVVSKPSTLPSNSYVH